MMFSYTEDELEEIISLKEEAELMGVFFDKAIKDGEPLIILRQIIEETTSDKLNYNYDF